MSQARSQTRRVSLRLSAALALALALGNAQAAAATCDAGKLRARLGALSRSSGWDATAETALVAEIENCVQDFRAAGGKAASPAAVRSLVENVYQRHAGWLAAKRDAIIAADGNLEAAQDSPEWRARENLAVRILYHRNWVYLEAATRYEPQSPRRRAWLEKAAEGFGRFIASDADPELAAESLYGRAIARRALGRTQEAVADLRRAMELSRAPELTRRIGAAIVETLVAAEQYSPALEASARLLARGRSGEAEFLRAKTLLLALNAPGVAGGRAAGYRAEVADLVARLERRGGRWSHLGRRLVAAGITRPEEWLEESRVPAIVWAVAESLRGQGKCDRAVPLYESLIEHAESPAPKARLALGDCQFRTGQHAAAFETLGAIKRDEKDKRVASDAAYLRFKAAEAMHHEQTTATSRKRVAAAAAVFVKAFPDHARAFEAFFRLGEIERERGELLAAAERFDAVGGDSPLRLQALFQSAQCYVEAWQARADEQAADAGEIAAGSLKRLRRFLDEAEKFREKRDERAADRVSLVPLQARARILGALVLTRRREVSDLQEGLRWLDNFEEAYPSEIELHCRARGIRTLALLDLHRFVEMQEAVRSFLACPRADTRGDRLIRRIGAECLELAEAELQADNSRAARVLRQTALAVYQELLRAVETGKAGSEPAEGLRTLVSRLRKETM